MVKTETELVAVVERVFEVGPVRLAFIKSGVVREVGPAADRGQPAASGVIRRRAVVAVRLAGPVVTISAGQQGDSEDVPEAAGVPADIVLAAAMEIGLADLLADDPGRLIPVERSAVVGSFVGESRQLDPVVIVDDPVNLAAPERLVAVVPVQPADAGKIIAVQGAPLVNAIHKKPIRNHWPAGGEEVFAGVLFIVFEDRDVLARLDRVRNVGGMAAKKFRRNDITSPNAPLVGTATRRGVQHSTGRTAEFRAETAGLELELVVELERRRTAAQSVAEICHVHAIDVVHVFGNGGAAEGRQTAESAVPQGCAGHQQTYRIDITRHRQLVDFHRQEHGRHLR